MSTEMLKLNRDTIIGNGTQLVRFKVVTLVFIVTLALAASVLSLSTVRYIMHSSGSIALETGPLTFSFSGSSELRYTYFGSDSMLATNWETTAATIQSYDMGPVIQKNLFSFYCTFPMATINDNNFAVDKLREALDALHARGIQYQVSMNVMYGVKDPSHRQINAYGTPVDWSDPCNPDFRNHIKAIVEELVQKYEIDGFSFDYVRYDSVDVPYGPYAKAAFEQYLGETITNWPGDFAPGGSRYTEFMQWRPQPIIELVRDMRIWMDNARQQYHPELPPLEYTITCWGMLYNYIYYYGQDAIGMVKEGAVDVLLPMAYQSDAATNLNHFLSYQALVGGPEGVVPIAPLIGATGVYLKSPAEFKLHYDTLLAENADGWSIWCYGGPGDEATGYADITPYWDLVPREPRFSLRDIGITSTSTSLTITWTTDLPATSKVEYSKSPIFVASLKQDPWNPGEQQWIKYWDFDYFPGTIIEDTAPKTSHQLTISGLVEGEPLYYRIQSEDSSGIATSRVYTFRP